MKQLYLNLNRYHMFARAGRWRLGFAKPVARMQSGFTLLEMIVVIALLSIVALSATSLIIDNGDLARQQATETRWDQIHDAIISQPNLYLNGSPYVRGYVADMGRLPVSIFELIRQSETTITYDEDGDAGTAEITIDQPDWTDINLGYVAAANYVATLGGGWNGPYLYTAGHSEFRDGWGREDQDVDQDAFNFGWVVGTNGEQLTEVTDLVIQSLGSDQDVGGNGDFTEDFPVNANIPEDAIVSEAEWLLNAAPITFNINFSNAIRAAPVGLNPVTLPPTVPPLPAAGAAQELELRVYRYVDNGDNVVDANDLLAVNADATFTLTDGASTASTTITPPIVDLTAVPPEGMPIGRYAALIWCTENDNPANTANDTVYDGDCEYDALTNPINHSPVYFTLTNNTTQVTLTWSLP